LEHLLPEEQKTIHPAVLGGLAGGVKFCIRGSTSSPPSSPWPHFALLFSCSLLASSLASPAFLTRLSCFAVVVFKLCADVSVADTYVYGGKTAKYELAAKACSAEVRIAKLTLARFY